MTGARASLVLLGRRGTRWLFAVGLLAVLLAWASETALGVIDIGDRLAYPLLALGFAGLSLALRLRPARLQTWQRAASLMLALYFTLSLAGFALRPDPGPSLYSIASLSPWLLGGMLLLFATWPATPALRLALVGVALSLAPAALRRFTGTPPPWLIEVWPLMLNACLAVSLACLALWGLSRQLSQLASLAPTGGKPGEKGDASRTSTTRQLVQSRLDELDAAREQAELASRAKSDFLAAMGHELRTPMNTVMGMTQIVLAGRLQGDQRECLHQVHAASASLLALIDRLLDFAALDSGRLQLQIGPLHVEDVIAGALDGVRQAAQAKQLELQCEFAAPALLDAAGWRQGDARRLGQILAELLGNAVKFTQAGQVRLTVDWQTQDGQERLSLRVRDSGIGMSASQVERLFTPFAQAETGVARRYAGTGLGLALAHRLAGLMGGELKARSQAGRGSEFELQLPLAPVLPAPASGVAPAQRLLLVQAGHSAGHNALVAQLQQLAPGSQIDVLGQGALALARLANRPVSQPYDLLLLDWVLPDMDGAQLLERLQALGGPPRARRVVLLSAFDTPALRERAQRLGAQALAAKPLLPPTLRSYLDPLQALAPLYIAAPTTHTAAATDHASLVSELDSLLGEADSDALSLWESHESEFMDFLPVQQVKALAGAMQRLDFDEAQAALRAAAPASMEKPR